MAFYEFTPEELEQVLGYLNDESGATPVPEAAAKLISLGTRLQKRLLEDAVRYRGKAAGLRRRLDRIIARHEGSLAKGEFAELGLDSVDIARTILHHIQEMRLACSRNKLLHITYIAYASWLAGKGERLCIEHPVATEWGPTFWRVYKNIPSTMTPVGSDSSKAVAGKNPGVAAFLANVARKYGDYREQDILKYVTGTPYKAALPEHNNGKWNKVINDTDIYEWKKGEERK